MMDIQTFNQEGLIPGPTETKESFMKRALFCQNLKNHFSKEFPDLKSEVEGGSYFDEAHSLTEPLFGCRPSWPPLLFSNHQLLPWQGGCAWIFESETEKTLGAFFQLRLAFKKQSKLLSLYERKELIAHEMAHAARLAFSEPQFEEVLAYQTSKTSWRRLFGPLFQSTWESSLFVLILFLITALNALALFEPATWTLIPWGLGVFGAFFACLFFRLLYRQRQFKNCRLNLQAITPKSDALLFRLSDHEIKLFAKLPKEEIFDYIQKEPSYRWEFLREVYFHGSHPCMHRI